jgi:hypothetical protein
VSAILQLNGNIGEIFELRVDTEMGEDFWDYSEETNAFCI